MDKKAIKFVAIGVIAALIVTKFEDGLIWNWVANNSQSVWNWGVTNFQSLWNQIWGAVYPKISSGVELFLRLSPYHFSMIRDNEYARWLMNLGTVATIGATIMYLRNSKDSKLNIFWKIVYIVIFFYVTWFTNMVMVFFWKRIDDTKPYFAMVSIALFNMLLWIGAYYVFFKSLMANEKIL